MSYKLLLAAFPLATSAVYVTYLHITLSRRVQCHTTPHLQDTSLPVPQSILSNPENYVINHECARTRVPTPSLKPLPNADLLTLFLRKTMSAFSTSLPAWSIWYCIKDPKDRKSFETNYIGDSDFEPGDRVCGVYVVSSRDDKRVELVLDPPRSYVGPVVQGMLVVEVVEKRDQMEFVNHTILWREKGKERPNALESAVGRWIHALMVRGLVKSGVQAVRANSEARKDN